MNGRNVAAALSVIEAAPLATPSDDGLSAFLRARPRLFGIAHRMLGSVAEAEDIVQDVWVRWQTTDRSRVCNPPAFLAAATARLAINVLQSARARREGSYASQCLTEPIDTSTDPAFGAERTEALQFAVLLLLEKLSPTERAAYVLREAFNYPYRTIAAILRMKETTVRQVVTRARVHVSGRRRAPVRSTSQYRLLNAFVTASRTGDLTRLERLLVSDVISNSEKRCDSVKRSTTRCKLTGARPSTPHMSLARFHGAVAPHVAI
jgi:RNA polymerase sigma factor (sigma-70 family)